ncbi:MAG: hypothetical protein CMM18_02535 [Rhodospirillaceae bacterium]|nr:hypothetical protein [Rhodospirillaceae bacterium]
MSKKIISQLHDRSLIKFSENDSRSLLQGLISNDISLIDNEKMIFSSMLSPQGKFFCDFFIFQPDKNNKENLYIDCNIIQTQEIIKKFNMYKLRANVKIVDVTENFSFFSYFEQLDISKFFEGDRKNLLSFCYVRNDPRLPELGNRIYVPKNLEKDFKKQFKYHFNNHLYEQIRIGLGIPDGIKDISPDKDFPLDYGYDQLNAISFSKGCYVGQEITARTHNRGKVKKKIFKINANKNLPKHNSEIYYKDKKIGKILSIFNTHGLAILEIKPAQECIDNSDVLKSCEIEITPSNVTWLN